MFAELVDALRCPWPHAESWLVATADHVVERHIVEGILGCPVCRAEFPVHRGVVALHGEGGAATPDAEPTDLLGVAGLRLAALLDLTDGAGFAVLHGRWGSAAAEVRAVAGTPLMLVNPPAGIEGEPGITVLRTSGPLPLAAGSARAIAVDVAPAPVVASAVRATAAGGRVVAPAGLEVPDDVRELARDERVWVGERVAALPLVSLHVRRGATRTPTPDAG